LPERDAPPGTSPDGGPRQRHGINDVNDVNDNVENVNNSTDNTNRGTGTGQ